MIRIWSLIQYVQEPRTYIWMDVVLVREAPRAILIIFDGRKAWIPKAWIVRIKQTGDGPIKIKISEYHWAKKFI